MWEIMGFSGSFSRLGTAWLAWNDVLWDAQANGRRVLAQLQVCPAQERARKTRGGHEQG